VTAISIVLKVRELGRGRGEW